MRLVACACLAVAAGVLVVASPPSGRASGGTLGDGCLVVAGGFGKISLTLTRGVVFGRFGEGTVKIEDLTADDGTPPRVYNAPQVRVGDRRYSYTGNLVRFRTSGAVRININAQFIDLSVVGKGVAVLWSGTFDVLNNLFSVDSASFCEEGFQELPVKSTRFVISNPDTSG